MGIRDKYRDKYRVKIGFVPTRRETLRRWKAGASAESIMAKPIRWEAPSKTP